MENKNFSMEIVNEKILEKYEEGGKFAHDYDLVKHEFEAMEKGMPVNWTVIVMVLNNGISFHGSGKIEGTQSLDNSAHGCAFCQKMQELGKIREDLICIQCYDMAQEEFKINSLCRHWLNMKILSIFDIPMEYINRLNVYVHIFRFNSSGDVENQQHAENLIKIAIAFPDARFGLWSKNQLAVDKAFDALGKPANMRFIQSSYFIGIPCIASRYADCRFTVYRKGDIDRAIEAGAMECNGKKCKACGYKCYLPENEGGWPAGSNIAELLREKRKAGNKKGSGKKASKK